MQSGIVLVDDLEQGLAVVDAYAAEHLEIQTRDAAAVAAPGAQRRRGVRRAVRAGLARRLRAPGPTTCCRPAGCACHSSGLSVRAFRKAVHVIEYDEQALRDVAPATSCTSPNAEDLPGHGAAVDVRVQED